MNLNLNRTSWVHLFPCKRFHVLLNSLFKVLCNFPSRYLFAIGLTVIFSLRWSLPPNLGCTLKQPDSTMRYLCWTRTLPWGLHPLWLELSLFKSIHKDLVQHDDTSSTWHRLDTGVPRPSRWAFPSSLAVTRGIAFAFFSSAELYA
jgi:hypothetical protein